MNHNSLLNAGVEEAEMVINSGLLRCSWDAILDTSSTSDSYKLHRYPNCTVMAFVCSPESCPVTGGDLVSSEELRETMSFDFVATRDNPSFAIDRRALAGFLSFMNEFHIELTNHQNTSSTPLIITGRSLGGSIASLYTLWLLDHVPPTTSRRPLCITFGSPLVGDKGFQQAISKRPTWNSSFLHVVSKEDNIISQISHIYKPFGTFLLCSNSGCACFEESETILELLMAMGSNFCQQNSLQIADYGQILEGLLHKSILRGVSLMNNSLTNLEAEILMQLTAIGVEMQGQDGVLNSLPTSIADRAKKLQTLNKNAFDPNKKLTERKIDMTYLEWYKKSSKNNGGYYDNYKNYPSSRDQIKTRQEIKKRHKILTNYWKRMVSEAEKMPQKEGVNFRIKWLYGGTNYRRLVEPLDIAEYYRSGRKDYVSLGRPQHYELLEKWFDDARPVNGVTEIRIKACSLTEDSCFWAHVEEATFACKELKDGERDLEEKRVLRDNLIGFENYVMDLIEKFAVCDEVFLPQSSFMQWWEEYSLIVGNVGNLALADFMRNDYKNYA